MDGYKIRFGEATQAANQLQSLIENLETQQKMVKETEETYLNEGNWNGPNKSEFKPLFETYETELSGLIKNAHEHHQALLKILDSYQKAEA